MKTILSILLLAFPALAADVWFDFDSTGGLSNIYYTNQVITSPAPVGYAGSDGTHAHPHWYYDSGGYAWAMKLDGSTYVMTATNGSWVHDDGTSTSTWTNLYASFAFHYWTNNDNGLNIRVTAENRGMDPWRGWKVSLFRFLPPATPINGAHVANSIEQPLILKGDWADRYWRLGATNISKPLTAQLWSVSGTYSVEVGTAFSGGYAATTEPGNYTQSNILAHTGYPGDSETIEFALRIGDSNNVWTGMADWVGTYTNKLTNWLSLRWTNRFPIARHFFCTDNYRYGLRNLGGYTSAGGANADVMSTTGKVYLLNQVSNYLNTSLLRLAEAKAQGVIVWDVESKAAQWASYNGQPDDIPEYARDAVDYFFNRLTNEGYAVGVCLRPQLAAKPIYNTLPVWNSAVAAGVTAGDNYYVANAFLELSNKVYYSYNRWGATLFYVDTDYAENSASGVVPASLWRRLALTFTNCLFLPESNNTVANHQYTAAYRTYSASELCTPTNILEMMPTAFCVYQYLQGTTSSNALAEAISRNSWQGDILLMDTTWSAANVAYMTNILKAVSFPGY